MQSIGSILGAAVLVSTTACAHVQPSEADSALQQEVASAESSPAGTTEAAQPMAMPSQEAVATTESTQAAPAADGAEPAQPSTPDNEATQATAVAESDPYPAEQKGEAVKQPIEIAHEKGDVAIGRFVLAHGIEGREPVDEASAFEPGERVYAYVQAVNPDGEQYELHVRWTKGEEDLGEPMPVTIGNSPRWRTWAYRSAPTEPGAYRCIIETADGQPIAEVPFEVKG
jgi:hypothetical protein